MHWVLTMLFDKTQDLTKLERLDIWGSNVSNQGLMYLKGFPKLKHLNLAWTNVTQIPVLPSLRHLNMANCTISSIFQDWQGMEGMMEELYLPGANILNLSEVFSGPWANNLSLIDLSSSVLKDVDFLDGKSKLEVLNLGGTIAGNASMKTVARIGFNLKLLDLSGCKVDSEGIGILADNLPKVEQLILSGTGVDDSVFRFLQQMPSLKRVDLSYTSIKGFLSFHIANKMV
jgi:Leucine-rich repeat (LRR) protein